MSIIKIKSPPSLCDLEQHVAIYLKDADIFPTCVILFAHSWVTWRIYITSETFLCNLIVLVWLSKNDLSSDNKF